MLKIPAGTRMYVTKRNPCLLYNNPRACMPPLYIYPDKTIINDSLYVAYDVRINGETLIMKGTRVLGDWVTESCPSLAAQLQLTQIFIQPEGQCIPADSRVIEAVAEYNNCEVNNVSHLYKLNQYRSTANICRRIVNVGCCVKTLLDNNVNTPYIKISTNEIEVIFTDDFIPLPR